ncbi:hypothetical protein KIN20_015808 [Parelaphostrongylus tenuis]|nr:hypothetical protein KIN20_015808 [Parelaphostrongylus tenuis]
MNSVRGYSASLIPFQLINRSPSSSFSTTAACKKAQRKNPFVTQAGNVDRKVGFIKKIAAVCITVESSTPR